MVLVVLPALIPDIEKVYDVYFSSFERDPMGKLMLQILFPGGITDEFRKAHAVGTLQWWTQSDSQYTFKCVDTETNEIVGMGLGDFYLRERSPEERANVGVQWLTGEEKERADKILTPLWEMREKLFGGRPYIYCHCIAVDPKHQGRQPPCQRGYRHPPVIRQEEKTQVKKGQDAEDNDDRDQGIALVLLEGGRAEREEAVSVGDVQLLRLNPITSAGGCEVDGIVAVARRPKTEESLDGHEELYEVVGHRGALLMERRKASLLRI